MYLGMSFHLTMTSLAFSCVHGHSFLATIFILCDCTSWSSKLQVGRKSDPNIIRHWFMREWVSLCIWNYTIGTWGFWAAIFSLPCVLRGIESQLEGMKQMHMQREEKIEKYMLFKMSRGFWAWEGILIILCILCSIINLIFT